MNHTHYPSLDDLKRDTVRRENIKAILVSILIGVSVGVFCALYLSR